MPQSQEVGEYLAGVVVIGEGMMTGTSAAFAISSSIAWEKVRTTIAAAYRVKGG